MWIQAGAAGFSLWPYHPYRRGDSWGGAARVVAVPVAREMTHEQWFLEQLPTIERVIGWVCAKRGLRGADAEDFGSIVKTRLIENEYEVLGKWQGRSTMKTYLTTCINRFYLDFQVQRFGKWRPSAEAKRLGAEAQRLEQLMFRDGLSFDEACEMMLSDPRMRLTRDDLHAIRLKLPQRRTRRGDLQEYEPVRPQGAAEAVERAERQALADKMFTVIRCSLSRLPPRERLFLKLHFQSGMTVADAARALGTADDKALYRKKEEILKRLKTDLEAERFSLEKAQELLSNLDWEAALGEDEDEDKDQDKDKDECGDEDKPGIAE
jgi:RNA polymerase sigma factor (sigma-70 family)